MIASAHCPPLDLTLAGQPGCKGLREHRLYCMTIDAKLDCPVYWVHAELLWVYYETFVAIHDQAHHKVLPMLGVCVTF